MNEEHTFFLPKTICAFKGHLTEWTKTGLEFLRPGKGGNEFFSLMRLLFVCSFLFHRLWALRGETLIKHTKDGNMGDVEDR